MNATQRDSWERRVKTFLAKPTYHHVYHLTTRCALVSGAFGYGIAISRELSQKAICTGKQVTYTLPLATRPFVSVRTIRNFYALSAKLNDGVPYMGFQIDQVISDAAATKWLRRTQRG